MRNFFKKKESKPDPKPNPAKSTADTGNEFEITSFDDLIANQQQEQPTKNQNRSGATFKHSTREEPLEYTKKSPLMESNAFMQDLLALNDLGGSASEDEDDMFSSGGRRERAGAGMFDKEALIQQRRAPLSAQVEESKFLPEKKIRAPETQPMKIEQKVIPITQQQQPASQPAKVVVQVQQPPPVTQTQPVKVAQTVPNPQVQPQNALPKVQPPAMPKVMPPGAMPPVRPPSSSEQQKRLEEMKREEQRMKDEKLAQQAREEEARQEELRKREIEKQEAERVAREQAQRQLEEYRKIHEQQARLEQEQRDREEKERRERKEQIEREEKQAREAKERAERQEQERQLQLEAQRIAEEKLEKERARLQFEKLEAERVQREIEQEKERLRQVEMDRVRKAEEIRQRQLLEKEKKERERIEEERLEQERIAAQQAEIARQQAEQAEIARQEAEKQEQARLEAEKAAEVARKTAEEEQARLELAKAAEEKALKIESKEQKRERELQERKTMIQQKIKKEREERLKRPSIVQPVAEKVVEPEQPVIEDEEPEFFNVLANAKKQTIVQAPIDEMISEEEDYFDRAFNLPQSGTRQTFVDMKAQSIINVMQLSSRVKVDQQLQPEDFDNNFVDFGDTRINAGRMGTERRQAISRPTRTQPPEIIESSESDLTDQDPVADYEIDSDYADEYVLQKNQPIELTIPTFTFKDNFVDFSEDVDQQNAVTERIQDESQDFMKLLQENELSYKQAAELNLQQQRAASKDRATSIHGHSKPQQSVISSPSYIDFQKHFNCQPSCIAVSQTTLLVGSQQGFVFAYNYVTEKPVGVHKETGKEFAENAVTSLDIHQKRPDYAVIGFQNGQLSLVSLSKFEKTVKLVKDHHKKAIVDVKFCDWAEEKPHFNLGYEHTCKKCENVEKWMFLSIDCEGKVVQTTVTHVSFGMCYASEFVIVDPMKQSLFYQVLAPRMSSSKHPMMFEDDNATIVAIGGNETVEIWLGQEKKIKMLRQYPKPMRYASQNMNCVAPITQQFPILAWGFGKTPRYNFETFPLLAVAWGPLIQLIVFKQFDADPDQNEDFDLDGFYIIPPDQTGSDDLMDISIASLHWIDESLLVAVTTNQEVRVMLTTKFMHEHFIEPEHMAEDVKFLSLDFRQKMIPKGTDLSLAQLQIEMERKTRLQPLVGSTQAVAVVEDKIFSLTVQGVYKMHHLHWRDSLGSIEQAVSKGSWIQVLAKARKIYLEKIKGFRIKDKDNLLEQLKDLVTQITSQILYQERQKLRTQQLSQEANNQMLVLMRVLIELCVEIQQPQFLFEDVVQLFNNDNRLLQFAHALKPYILSGVFADVLIREDILNESVISVFLKEMSDNQKIILNGKSGLTVPAEISTNENFEKVLLSFRLDQCTKDFKIATLDYCKQFKLSSALVYLNLQTYEEQGPVKSIATLTDFYLDVFQQEATDEKQHYTREDVYRLKQLPDNSWDRIMIERSSIYLSLKLMYTIRLFLMGKKFPHGHFNTQEWHLLCHDVTDLITSELMIDILTQVDAAAYFQILSIVFNNPSFQYTFISSGRPSESAKAPMTHLEIVQRVSSYFLAQGSVNQYYLHYLCFIASVAGSYDDSQYHQYYYDVLLQLIKNSDTLMQFNRGNLERRMTNGQMYRRLSKSGVTVADDLKHVVVTEQMLLQLIETLRPMLSEDKEKLKELIQEVKDGFLSVRLLLYELDEDYLKCLKLFMRKNDTDSSIKSLVKSQGFADGFTWIREKHVHLDSLTARDNKTAKKQLEHFEKEVLNYGMFLLAQDVVKTIELFEATIKTGHMDLLEKLGNDPAMQYYYIEKLLELKREDVKNLFTGQSTKQPLRLGDNKKWTDILTLHVKLICTLYPHQVTVEIKKIIKENFYPMEACLKVCVQFEQVEAQALLNKKIGNYTNAITLYLQVVKTDLNYLALKKELFYLRKERNRHEEVNFQKQAALNKAELERMMEEGEGSGKILGTLLRQMSNALKLHKQEENQNLYAAWVDKFAPNINLLDRVFKRIFRIIEKYPNEVLKSSDDLWTTILTLMFQIQMHPAIRKKVYCKVYLKQKMINFCRIILTVIPFGSIIYAATQLTHNLRFKSIKELVHDVLSDKSQEIQMCENAMTTQMRDLAEITRLVRSSVEAGLAFQEQCLLCGICNMSITGRQLKSSSVVIGDNTRHDEALLFDCLTLSHSFHLRCLNSLFKTEQQNKRSQQPLRCPTCYPKSYQILMATAQSLKSQAPDQDSESSSSTTTSDMPPMQETQAQQTFQKRMEQQKMKKLMQREKNMKQFDLDQRTLALADFKY